MQNTQDEIRARKIAIARMGKDEWDKATPEEKANAVKAELWADGLQNTGAFFINPRRNE